MKTPVGLPARRSGALPAFSSASHVTSSSRRCCGSMFWASRGAMPKQSGIEPSTCAEEAAAARGQLARRIRIGIVVGVDVPAVARRLGDRIPAVAQEIPVQVRAYRHRRENGSPCRRSRSARDARPPARPRAVQFARQQCQPLRRIASDAVQEIRHHPNPVRRSKSASISSSDI